MNRITTAGLAGLMLLAAGPVTSASAADKLVININMFGPKRALTIGMETVAEGVNNLAGGKAEVKIHYGSALGPEKQTPESIKSGGYEGGQMCVGYYPNKFPLLGVMELPFLLPKDLKARAKVETAVMNHPEIMKEMKGRWNVRYFAPALLPPYEFMGNKRIAKAEDFKGVKLRISGLNAKALEEFGGVPTMVTAPEGYTALERGTIDSFGFPYSYAFGAYKLYEVSKYSTEGVAMSGFMCWNGISATAYDQLPADVKEALPDLQAKAQEASFAAYEKADAKWIPIFKEKLEVIQFPPEERAKLADGAQKYWSEWVERQEAAGRPGKKMLEFVKAEVAKATGN
jgi:TRAP-type C4-dicarboxylate transport system substrate-binding protein